MAEIALPRPASAQAPDGRGLKPGDVEPANLVAQLIAEGETDYALVDFPRKRKDGTVIAKVHVRLLSDEEETLAIANAIAEMGRLLKSGDVKDDSTLRHNLTVRHILAAACRHPDDPKQPFFRHGVVDVRQFMARELAEMWLAYIAVQNAALPSLGEMTGPELEAWAERVKEGVELFPFYFSSQERVKDFLLSVVRYVVSKSRPSGTPPTADAGTETGSSGSA